MNERLHVKDTQTRRWPWKRIAAGFGMAAITGLAVANAPAERAAQAAAPAVQSQLPDAELAREIVRGGEAGFVVTSIAYALGPDGKGGACPNGLSGGVRGAADAYAKTPAGQRRTDETDQAYQRRLNMAVFTAPNGQNLCMNPEAGAPDPGWRMVSGKVPVDGIDLDGQDGGKRPAAGTCAHENFEGTHGDRGVDNQFYRVIGCSTGYQSTGQGNGFDTEMYTGSWGILIRLRGVDDLRNDPDVEVGIYANADPIQLSADRKALPYATYAITQDPKYRATTRGRIVDGVLTIDPVDVRFLNYVNSMRDDRILRDARLRLRFTPEGGMEGFLAGYWPIDSAYDLGFGSRNSQAAKGGLAPLRLRLNTAMGRAGALGHTCHGAWFALHQAADGHRDPATGRCTSISTQYRIKVLPAFIVDAKTQSVNAPPSVS